MTTHENQDADANPDPIRHLAASFRSSRIAIAAFKRTAATLQIDGSEHSGPFDTVLDFGGSRLALSADGQRLFTCAYQRLGMAAYESRTGRIVWTRRDVKRTQSLTVSPSTGALYVGRDDQPLLVVASETGETLEQIRGVKKLVESPYAPLAMLDRRRPTVVRMPSRSSVFEVERTSFAFLGVAFGSNALAVSEAGGPVRCFDAQSGEVLWTYHPNEGSHCLELAYCEDAGVFAGVIWSYEHGGDQRLVRFDPRGRPKLVRNLGTPAETCFTSRGSELFTSQGERISIATGRAERIRGFGLDPPGP
jgi:hypothetical protein